MASAVRDLVASAVSVSAGYQIDVDEEPVPDYQRPLPITADLAVSGLVIAATTTLLVARLVRNGVSMGGHVAAELAGTAAATAADIRSGAIGIEEAANFLQEAEDEGRHAFENLRAYLANIRDLAIVVSD